MTRKHINNRMQEKLNNFGVKYGKHREHNKKAKSISNKVKGLEGLEEGPKAKIHIDLLRMTLKKNQIGKCHGIDRFWFKKFTTIHDRLALEMNRCLQEAHVPE